MTCVVGVKENNNVWIGADKSSVAGYLMRSTNIDKVFRKGEYVIGYTTSFRMGQLLQHVINLPEPPEKIDVGFMVLEFVENIRKGFKEYGYSKIDNNEETGGTFIVGVKNQLFQIDDDYQVNYSDDNYLSCGAGVYYALSSMEALKSVLPPEERIKESIRIAGKFCTSVLPECKIIKV
jgi:ATP-dependent protease HslVU (ClpYQ) peptidase subunit